MADLYFMLNPALGIVKIGISSHVERRRRSLEDACGVPVDLLGVLPDGSAYEEDLHLAFAHARLCGEWFVPTVELLALADDPERVPAFVRREAVLIAERRTEAREAERARKGRAIAERTERRRFARERGMEALAALEARLRLTEEESRAARRAELAALQDAHRAALRNDPDLALRVLPGNEATRAETRRAMLGDRVPGDIA